MGEDGADLGLADLRQVLALDDYAAGAEAAELAAGGRDDVDGDALRGILRHERAGAGGLVVGVRVDGQDGSGHDAILLGAARASAEPYRARLSRASFRISPLLGTRATEHRLTELVGGLRRGERGVVISSVIGRLTRELIDETLQALRSFEPGR